MNRMVADFILITTQRCPCHWLIFFVIDSGLYWQLNIFLSFQMAMLNIVDVIVTAT